MESRQPECYAAVTTCLASACIALALRLWARKLKNFRLRLDDHLILVAFVCNH